MFNVGVQASTKISGTWTDISNIYTKVSGAWKTVTAGYVKVSGAWKALFNSGITFISTAAGFGDRQVTQFRFRWIRTAVVVVS